MLGAMSPDQPNSQESLPVTFMADDGSIVINFGILCGREATQAEIDRLAQALNDQAGAGPDITIISSRRQDYGHGIETITHQVTVEATGVLSALPETVCSSWVESCAAERRVESLGLASSPPGSSPQSRTRPEEPEREAFSVLRAGG